MLKFSDILEELINNKNLPKTKIAKLCGVSDVQLGRYLKGSYPNIYNAEKLAIYFNVSFDYLFGITERNYIKNFKPIDISVFLSRYNELLNINKITHYKFSQKYQFSESIIRKWKTGQIPKLETLILIAEELSSSIDYLVGRI